METHPLAGSGVRVTRLSFGGAGIGNLFTPVSDEAAAGAVDAAWDAGIRYFDTAPHYGLGLSERRVGAALRARPRDQYVISTKVGRLIVPADGASGDDMEHGFAVPANRRRVWDFTADGVRRSAEESLERLGLDRIDILYLHDPDDHARQALDEAYPALERMRAEGLVRAIGIGMNQTAIPTRFLRETDIDVVLLAGRYTLLDQSGLAELLPEAERRGKSVVIGGVFNSGLLADPRPGATYDYTTAPKEIVDRALHMQELARRHDTPLRAAAVCFPFAHPAVASVLVGTRSADEARDAVSMLDHAVPSGLWRDLRAADLLPPEAPVPEEK